MKNGDNFSFTKDPTKVSVDHYQGIAATESIADVSGLSCPDGGRLYDYVINASHIVGFFERLLTKAANISLNNFLV
jgi:hypothetical protein